MQKCRGNVDDQSAHLPDFRLVSLCGWKILLVHIAGMPPRTTPACLKLVKLHGPDIVVFGHSHKQAVEVHDSMLWVNPGSAGVSSEGKSADIVPVAQDQQHHQRLPHSALA